MMFDNDNPRNWREQYDKIAIFRVHHSLSEVRRCPICMKVIENQHGEANLEDNNKHEVLGFEMR